MNFDNLNLKSFKRDNNSYILFENQHVEVRLIKYSAEKASLVYTNLDNGKFNIINFTDLEAMKKYVYETIGKKLEIDDRRSFRWPQNDESIFE